MWPFMLIARHYKERDVTVTRKCLIFLLAAFPLIAVGQTATDHLSAEEVAAAIAAKPNTGIVTIEDKGFTTPTTCAAQMPTEVLFTAQGLVNARSVAAKKQYLPYVATEEETRRVLTVVSFGCAGPGAGGPGCTSITRAAILSDMAGTVVVEALSSAPRPVSWHNGYGATASCTDLTSKFSLTDVQKARNVKGEFIIATFSGSTLIKAYTVKEKHLKPLGMDVR